jgi:hypothetical protein
MIVVPTTSAHAETLHFAFKGRTAGAFFTSVDPTGCVETQVGVTARDGEVKAGKGGFEQERSATIFIDKFDTCLAGSPLLTGFGEPTPTADQLRIDGLDSASLNAEIELFDFVSSTSFRVIVGLTWTGVGDAIVADKFHDHFMSHNFSYNAHASGTFRPAGVTGSVVDGTTNLTPSPPESPQLSSVKSSTVFILHP